LPEQLEAGEYGFVWVKNMELKELPSLHLGLIGKAALSFCHYLILLIIYRQKPFLKI